MDASRSAPSPLSRRRFLALSGAAAAGALVPALPARAAGERVLVLGAGIAGLAAAQRLHQLGYRGAGQVVVLEARDRLGGRILTDRRLGVPVELGATWIHGVKGNPLTALADSLGLRRLPTDYDSAAVFDRDGARVSAADLRSTYARFGDDYDALLEYRDDELDDDQSVAASLADLGVWNGLDARRRRLLDWHWFTEVELDFSLTLEKLSSFQLDEDGELPGRDELFPQGMSQLVDGVAAGVDVRLRQTVRRVEWGSRRIKVVTGSGSFEADRCVVALPLGVLQARGVTFQPELPASIRRAVGRLAFGDAWRLALRFPRSFWDLRTQFFGLIGSSRSDSLELTEGSRSSGAPVLLANASGPRARELEAMGTVAATREVMTAIRRAWRGAPDPTQAVSSAWCLSPLTGGAYSYWGVGSTPGDFEAFAANPGERLFFAGEHTHGVYPGTAHGALLSGRRAAAAAADAG